MSKSKKNRVFWVRLKIYEPDKPHSKFKPPVLKGLVYAPNAENAGQTAIDAHIDDIKAQFPRAELKVLESKRLMADFSVTSELD